jgi:hypothetical protein
VSEKIEAIRFSHDSSWSIEQLQVCQAHRDRGLLLEHIDAQAARITGLVFELDRLAQIVRDVNRVYGPKHGGILWDDIREIASTGWRTKPTPSWPSIAAGV